jgi:heptosyltransferase-2
VILEGHPLISEIVTMPRRKGWRYYVDRIMTFYEIRKRKYDLVIDHKDVPGTVQISLISGAPLKLGYINGKGRRFYNLLADRGETKYSASKKFDILKPLGIEEKEYSLYFKIKDEAKEYIRKWIVKENLNNEKFICISPGSPVLGKAWKPSNFARLADLILKNTNYKVILLWAPNEYDNVMNVQNEMAEAPIFAPRTDINQAAALLKYCELLICNDGGLNHLSVAINVPSLAIFGMTSPKAWSPQGVFENHYHLHNPNWEFNRSFDFGITPEEAFEKTKEILNLS